jgi:hypothetical protein
MRPQDYDQEELLMMMQDVLTSAASGHTEHLHCPVCERGELTCEDGDEDGWLRLECPQCGLKFEGLLENPEINYVPNKSGRKNDPFG